MLFHPHQFSINDLSCFPLASFQRKPRTIFHRAMDASKLKWHDSHLKLILSKDPSYPECPMWHGEHYRLY